MLYSGPVRDVPNRSGTVDISTEVKTDMPASKRRAVVTRRLIALAGGGGRPSRSDVPALERSRNLLEQAFDKGMCEEEKAHVLDPFMRSWFPHLYNPRVVPY